VSASRRLATARCDLDIVGQAVAPSALALGALDAWPGWLGLAITVAPWVGSSSPRSPAAPVRFDTALTDAIGLDPPITRRSAGRSPSSRSCCATGGSSASRTSVRRRTGGATARRTARGPEQREALPSAQIHGAAVIGDKSQQGSLMLHLPPKAGCASRSTTG
jgi:hypothetical protein